MMRIYFLVNNMVGRLLDQFYGDLCKFKNIFSDLSTIPIYKTNVDCFIPPIEHGSLLQDLDGTVAVNEARESAWYSDTYYTFFYELVSNLVCSCKFKSLDGSDINSEEGSPKSTSKDSARRSHDSLSNSEKDENPAEEVKKEENVIQSKDSRPQSPSKSSDGMSPFFNEGDHPYLLSEEEQALLLLPTEPMFTRLFKTWNCYLATSRSLGKMYAHISWANKEFSKIYLGLLGQFIQDADHHEIKKKFKIPLMQVLLLKDSDTLIQLRAKIAMKHLFSQLFVNIKDKYYVLGLEIIQLIFHLAHNIESIHVLFRKHKQLLYPKMLDFLERDPIVSISQMQWVPNIPRNSTTLDLNIRLLTPAIEDMIRLNILDKRNQLNTLFNPSQALAYMDIWDTLVPIYYRSGDELYFFSDKYKDWIHSFVMQEISNEVIYIEWELSSKERNTPIFVFREVLETLDKDILGDSIQEIESSAYFHRLFKVISFES